MLREQRDSSRDRPEVLELARREPRALLEVRVRGVCTLPGGGFRRRDRATDPEERRGGPSWHRPRHLKSTGVTAHAGSLIGCGAGTLPRRTRRSTAAATPAARPAEVSPHARDTGHQAPHPPVRRPPADHPGAVDAAAQHARGVPQRRSRGSGEGRGSPARTPGSAAPRGCAVCRTGSGGRSDGPWRTRRRRGRRPRRVRTPRATRWRVIRSPMSLSSRALVPG